MINKKLFTKVVAIAVVFLNFGNFNYTNAYATENEADTKDEPNFELNVKANDEGNYVDLDWTKLDEQNYGEFDNSKRHSYMVYSKQSNIDGEFKSVPVNCGKVRVLNIYPDTYMATEGEGENKIQVEKNAGDQLAQWMKEPSLDLVGYQNDKDKNKDDDKFKDCVKVDLSKYIGTGVGDDKYMDSFKDETAYYKYIKYGDIKNKYKIKTDIENIDNCFVTNGKGLIEPDPNDDTKPHIVKDDNGEEHYVYAKDKDGKEVKELIDVTEVSIDEFNDNPDEFLGNKGNYKYDVVYEGGWDQNNKKMLNKKASDALNTFINNGYGFLAGHDTIAACNQNEKDIYPLMKLTPGISGLDQTQNPGSNYIYITKPGLLNNYPWEIGRDNRKIFVPYTHDWFQFSTGDVWSSFKIDASRKEILKYNGENGTNNFYLTTYKNTAMIQTGHSQGKATPDEQKILANTLFYLSQVTFDNKSEGHNAQDLDAPETPEIEYVSANFNQNNVNVNCESVKDLGTSYDYYVEATNLADYSKIKSNTVSGIKVTTGVDKYLITYDNNPNTKISEKTKENSMNDKNRFDGIDSSDSTSFTINTKNGELKGVIYVHVAAMDKAGNISETSTAVIGLIK